MTCRALSAFGATNSETKDSPEAGRRLSKTALGQLALPVNHSCIFTDSSPQKVSAPEKVSLCSQ